jgi:hypothetical protein
LVAHFSQSFCYNNLKIGDFEVRDCHRKSWSWKRSSRSSNSDIYRLIPW